MTFFFRNKYNSFYNSINSDFCTIPIGDSNYIPQGVCKFHDFVIIACYDYHHIKNSILFICGSKNYLKRVYLDGKMHCGGIGYYEKADKIFITGVGKGEKSYINRYSGKDLLLAKDFSTIFVEKKFCVDDNCSLYSSSAKHSSPSFLTIFNDKLYVGNYVSFVHKSKHKAFIKEYNIFDNGDVSDKFNLYRNIYSNTQSICIVKKDNRLVYLFSRSFGRRRKSLINVCILEKNKFISKEKIILPAMLQQINLYDEYLMVIFESCADCYSSTCITYNDKVYFLDFDKLFSFADL